MKIKSLITTYAESRIYGNGVSNDLFKEVQNTICSQLFINSLFHHNKEIKYTFIITT